MLLVCVTLEVSFVCLVRNDFIAYKLCTKYNLIHTLQPVSYVLFLNYKHIQLYSYLLAANITYKTIIMNVYWLALIKREL